VATSFEVAACVRHAVHHTRRCTQVTPNHCVTRLLVLTSRVAPATTEAQSLAHWRCENALPCNVLVVVLHQHNQRCVQPRMRSLMWRSCWRIGCVRRVCTAVAMIQQLRDEALGNMACARWHIDRKRHELRHKVDAIANRLVLQKQAGRGFEWQ
jgi:hypothetical protein